MEFGDKVLHLTCWKVVWIQCKIFVLMKYNAYVCALRVKNGNCNDVFLILAGFKINEAYYDHGSIYPETEY